MGLIKAAFGAAGSTLGDQWREYFYCDSMDETILMQKGAKRVSKRSSNTKGSDNMITNGSIIAVNEGQCMMIVDQGGIVEFTAEPGEFTWDSSTEPTIFYGGLGQGVKGSWQTFKRRFTFGGDTAKDQRIYYFNIKELIGNKYGTANPVPFRVVDKNIGLDMDISIRCFGEYSYRLTDPILFYKNVCGNAAEEYSRERLDGQLKSEFLTALQPAFARISEMGVRYSALPGHTQELADVMNQVLSAKWSNLRGISVISVGVSSVKASAEDEDMLKQLQKSAVYRNPNMAGAALVDAQAEAMKSAAKNDKGAMMGFMGMNMAQNVGGLNANALFQMGSNASPAAQENRWRCRCGAENTGKFCTECGAPKISGWICANCGEVNQGKFCANCGGKKPADEPLYRCDKCGWEPEDPKNPPKFCPECGDPFGVEDMQ